MAMLEAALGGLWGLCPVSLKHALPESLNVVTWMKCPGVCRGDVTSCRTSQSHSRLRGVLSHLQSVHSPPRNMARL